MKKYLKHVLSTAVWVLPAVALGETSALQTLSGVPALSVAANASEQSGFAPMVNSLYMMSIGLGAVMAVFVIIFAGIKHAASDSFGVKSDLKERMVYAIGGLVILLGAYVFLEYINPNFTDFTATNLGIQGEVQDEFSALETDITHDQTQGEINPQQ